jgi:hypothetical protein
MIDDDECGAISGMTGNGNRILYLIRAVTNDHNTITKKIKV